MSDQLSGRPAVPNTTTTHTTNRDTGHTGTRELYEAGFSTTGGHPQAGIALARTLDEARQRLADMLVFCDPTAPAIADIIAFHRGGTVERYDGTAGDIFTRVNAGTPGRTVHRPPPHHQHRCRGRWGAVSVMCLTLASVSAIIDHHPNLRPAGRGYTRTFHHASQLSPGDLWRPDPDQDPHTVTEVHRTRGRKYGPDRITLVDQYARPFRYRSNELVATAIADQSNVYQRCICQEPTR